MSRPFLVGEKVTAFGCDGIVIKTDCPKPLEIKVRFVVHEEDIFTAEGKAWLWSWEPSLKHLDPPAKKMVKKKMWVCATEGCPVDENGSLRWGLKITPVQVECEVESDD